MKVFCLLIEETSNWDVFETRIPIVSTDYDKVKSAFDEFLDDNKPYYKDFVVATDTEDCYIAYEDGSYTENHISIQIMEKELDVLNWND
jgi:flavodoxin